MSFRIYIILIFLSYFSNLNAQENELFVLNNNQFQELYSKKKLKAYTVTHQIYKDGKIYKKITNSKFEINRNGLITSQIFLNQTDTAKFTFFYNSNNSILSYNLIDIQCIVQKKDSQVTNYYRREYSYNENNNLFKDCYFDSIKNEKMRLRNCNFIKYTNGKINLVLSQNNDTIELYIYKNDTVYKYIDAASIAKYVDGKIISLETYNEKSIVKYNRKGKIRNVEIFDFNGYFIGNYSYKYKNKLINKVIHRDRYYKIIYIENYEYSYY